MAPLPGRGPVVVGTLRRACPQTPAAEASEGSEQEERERLRKVLKQMGRLRCPQEVSGAAQVRGPQARAAQPLVGH